MGHHHGCSNLSHKIDGFICSYLSHIILGFIANSRFIKEEGRNTFTRLPLPSQQSNGQNLAIHPWMPTTVATLSKDDGYQESSYLSNELLGFVADSRLIRELQVNTNNASVGLQHTIQQKAEIIALQHETALIFRRWYKTCSRTLTGTVSSSHQYMQNSTNHSKGQCGVPGCT